MSRSPNTSVATECSKVPSLGRRLASPIIRAYWRPILLVLLPFAAGYFLSYFFRTINAVIAGQLTAELGLDASPRTDDVGLFSDFRSHSVTTGRVIGSFWASAGAKRVAHRCRRWRGIVRKE